MIVFVITVLSHPLFLVSFMSLSLLEILYVVPYNAIATDLCNRAGFQKYVDEHKLKFVTFNKFSELESSKRLCE